MYVYIYIYIYGVVYGFGMQVALPKSPWEAAFQRSMVAAVEGEEDDVRNNTKIHKYIYTYI